MRKTLIKTFTILSILFTYTSTYSFAKGKKIITVLMPAPFADSTKNIIKEFNQSQKDLFVKVTRGPRETEAVSDLAISSLVLGGSPYDIILVDVTWLPKYAAADWLIPLNKDIKKDRWDGLSKGAKLGNSYKGKIYRWPLTADIGLLYWRKDLMKSPPKTNLELIRISKRLLKEKKVRYGYVWQGRQYEGLSCVFLEVLSGYGGKWLNSSGEPELNSSNATNAVNFLKDLLNNGISPKAVTNYSENEALQSFESGESAFMRNWPYAWSLLQNDNSKVKGKIGITSITSDGEFKSRSTLGSWGFSILKTTKYPKESFKVISYLTSNRSQRELFLKYGYIPTSSILFYDKEMLSKMPVLKDLKNSLDNAIARPKHALYSQVSDILQRNLSSILTNQIDTKNGLDKAQIGTERILKSAGNIK